MGLSPMVLKSVFAAAKQMNANGATVLHQVVFGNRMVALEGFVPRDSAPRCEWDELPDWIAQAGYGIDEVEADSRNPVLD